MNAIDYITITCNKIKYVRLQITSDYMIKCNQLHLITITNYDNPMSGNQHHELPVGPVNYCFQQFTVSTHTYTLFQLSLADMLLSAQLFILYYFLNNLLSKVSYNFSQLYFLSMILSVLFYFYFVFFEVTMLFVNLFICSICHNSDKNQF